MRLTVHNEFMSVVGSFNPRTRKGCDLLVLYSFGSSLGFNPRTRKGCDRLARHSSINFFVSTHAPVKDATSFYNLLSPGLDCFNPRTRKGCDFISSCKV